MFARAERHVRIEQHGFLPRLFLIVDPFGHDYDLIQANGTEVLFPDFDPIVPFYLALRIFERTEIDRARGIFFARRDLAHDRGKTALPRGRVRNNI